MASPWSALFASKCRHHVYLRTVAVGDEPLTNTAIAIVMWTSTWQQFLDISQPVSRIHLPCLASFTHHMHTEGIQLMGATTVGHDEYLQQGCIVSEVAAELDRQQILEEFRAATPRLAQWRADLDIVRANMVDRLLGALAATAENMYDFVPELFIQSLCDLSTHLNSMINEVLQIRSTYAVPERVHNLEPTGGSDGRASTREQTHMAYMNRVRASQTEALESLPGS
eukprot:s29_g23.t1